MSKLECALAYAVKKDVPNCMPKYVDLNLLPSSTVLWVKYLTIVCMCISIVSASLVYYWRGTKVIKHTQPFFMYLILAGCFATQVAIFISDISDEDASTNRCQAFWWLYSTGFVLTFSALFAKVLRLYKLIQVAAKMEMVLIRVRDVIAYCFLFLTLDGVVLIFWSVSSPSTYIRSVTERDVNGYTLKSSGFCDGPIDSYAIAAILGIYIHMYTYIYIYIYIHIYDQNTRYKRCTSLYHQLRLSSCT
jgi:hypothetical protein